MQIPKITRRRDSFAQSLWGCTLDSHEQAVSLVHGLSCRRVWTTIRHGKKGYTVMVYEKDVPKLESLLGVHETRSSDEQS